MKRKLSEFPRPQQPTYQIPNDKERRTVPIKPNKEAPVKKQQTSHRKGIKTDDISSAKLGPDKKNN